MQLVAGRTAQEFNKRKNRRGAFWEDRYHSTAVQTDGHLLQCVTYIDLNMVRAGAVEHPEEWDVTGYAEIQSPWKRKRVIDFEMLCTLLDVGSAEELARLQKKAVEDTLDYSLRQPAWTEAVGVGDADFLDELRLDLGARGLHRHKEIRNGLYYLQEAADPYSAEKDPKMASLSG